MLHIQKIKKIQPYRKLIVKNSGSQFEIFNQYDDALKNAPIFRIYRGIFKSDIEKKYFNDKCQEIKDKIMPFLSDDGVNALNKLSSYIALSDNEKKSFLKKILNTRKFIEKKENEYNFNDWIKQIFINLLYGEETFRYIRYSRNLNNYIKGEYYYKLLVHLNEEKKPKDIKLYYYTFLFIIDSLNILDLIEHKIGYYNSCSNNGKESRMKLSNKGKSLFSKIENTVFESIKDHELIIKTDRVAIATKRGTKYKIKNIIYNESVEIRRKKLFIKKINEIYNNAKLIVNANNIIIDNSSFLDELFLYSRNNSLSLSFLNCELRNNDQDRRYTFIKYLDKLNNIDNKLISVSDKRVWRREGEGIGNTLSLLMLDCDSYNEYARLQLQQSIENGERVKNKGDDFLKINKIKFEINKKYLFRVFSRNSWLKHGRWYGALWTNLPKVLRKNIYLNDSNEPLVRLDYKAFHPRMAYHLKGIPYYDDPYIINRYGQDRDIFKIVALVGINADSEKSAIMAIREKLFEENITKNLISYQEAKNYLLAFKNQHNEIRDFILSDTGVEMMFYDSEIIADCLNELMLKKGIFILTCHDEILCERKYVHEVKNQMEISYRKILRKALIALIERKILDKNQEMPDELQPLIDIEWPGGSEI